MIIGASSGIGRELALLLAAENYLVGITGRRKELLGELQQQDPVKFRTAAFDVIDTDRLIPNLELLLEKLGGLDLLVISAGTGDLNDALDFDIEKRTIDTNVTAFTAIAGWAYRYFENQGYGHLAAISSIAGLRGGRAAPAYNASKAYQVNYLEGLRQKAKNKKLTLSITDIRPGFVATAMAKGEGLFWVAPANKVARQIRHAIHNRKRKVYVTRRWGILAGLVKILPGWLYEKM